MEGHAATFLALSHGGGVELDIAHTFSAASDHHIRHAGLDHHRRIGNGLNTAPTTPVDLGARDRQGEVRGKGGPTPNAGRLTRRITLGKNHFIDALGV